MVNGKIIRRQAWRMSKERRWPLVGLSLLTNAPVFIALLLPSLYRTASNGGTLPQWVSWPFSVVGNFLNLGLIMVAFRYIDGDDAHGGFFFYASRARFGKALLLILSLLAVSTGFSFVSTGLTNYGKALELAGMEDRLFQPLGSVVGIAGSLLTGIFLFFARYLFVREPDGSLWGHWKRSFSLGSDYFIETFVFLFWLGAPLLVSFFAAAALMAALIPVGFAAFAVVTLLFLVGFLIFYLPYATMANVLFADTVIREAEKEARNRERKKMAVKGGEGWYAVDMVTGETKRGTVEKNEDEPWE